jgi:hypothetical protein
LRPPYQFTKAIPPLHSKRFRWRKDDCRVETWAKEFALLIHFNFDNESRWLVLVRFFVHHEFHREELLHNIGGDRRVITPTDRDPAHKFSSQRSTRAEKIPFEKPAPGGTAKPAPSLDEQPFRSFNFSC